MISYSLPSTIPTMADLRLLSGSYVGYAVKLLGYFAAGDGGGGTFVWTGVNLSTDNGGTLINGWKRVFNGPLLAPWFGAIGANTTTDYGAGIVLMEAAASDDDTLMFPKGTYRSTLPIVSTKRLNWIGDGFMSQLFMDGNETLLSVSDTREIRIAGLALFSNNTDSAKAVLQLTCVHSSNLDLHLLGGYTSLKMVGCLLNTARIHISQNTGGTPTGWTPSTTANAVVLQVALTPSQIACNANTFINPVLEGVGTGFSISGQGTTPGIGGVGETDTQIIGGTVESCSVGVECDGIYQPMIIEGTHFEGNQRDVDIKRSSNISVRNAYLYSYLSPPGITFDQSTNIYFENCLIHSLEVSSSCSRVESKRCIIRTVSDASPDARFDNIQYVDQGESPYGPSDGSVYGRVRVDDQSVINSNPTLSIWTSPTLPDGYGAQDSVAITQDFSIYRTGNSSAKIVASYAPGAHQGITYTLPAGLLDEWITVEVWSYSGLAGNVVVEIGKTGGWRSGANFSQIVNGWMKTVVSFRVDVNSEKIMITGSLSTNEVSPAYIDSIRIFARTWT